jgi:NAD+ diphosphatase
MQQPLAFSGSSLDRASNQRTDAAWVESQIAAVESRFLPVWRLQALVKSSDPPALAWATDAVLEFASKTTGPVLLGLRDGIAHFAADVSAIENPVEELGLEGAASFAEARAVALSLPAGESAIFAQARSLLEWHATHGFCANCGEKTRSVQGGEIRFCADCQTEHFPRTNPVVIMIASLGERCLLGRQRGWPAGMYSPLAGFVDQGETIEEAVRREVMEEVGVRVGAVRYHASQPWPFPSSLMIGCMAEAESEEISLSGIELQDAQWFTRDQLRKVLSSAGSAEGVSVPPPLSISHHLVKAWVG